MSSLQPRRGFSFGKKTAVAATAIVRAIFPEPGVGTGVKGSGIIHVTSMGYVVGTTAHTLTVMRPLNYTTFAANAAAAQAVVNLTADPGIYSAGGYQYGLPNAQTAPRVADNALAAADIVVYQVADGTWVQDTVASLSGTAVTLTTNVPTGGVKAGGLFYNFGAVADLDPATGEAHMQMDIVAAAAATLLTVYQATLGIWQTLHPGDPMVLHSNNLTAAGAFAFISGYYGNG